VRAPDGIIDAQVRSLLEALERDRIQRCANEVSAAQTRAAKMLRTARAEARRRVRDAASAERARISAALQRERAALDTRRRKEEQTAMQAVVSRAWELLPAALVKRWRTVDARLSWCETAIERAARHLRANPWTLELAEGPDAAEHMRLLHAARERCAGEHRIEIHPALPAGLRIRAEGALLDASLEGLLTDRGAIEAQIMAQWLRVVTQEASPGAGA
jgi:hypothetical protein